MTRKILLIGAAEEWSRDIVAPNITVQVRVSDSRPPHCDDEFHKRIAVDDVIAAAVGAESNGFDALVIGCVYDPGLREARQHVRMPVVGIGEAMLHVAAMLSAGQFSVVVGRRSGIPRLIDIARTYGLDSRIASWRALDIDGQDTKDRGDLRAQIRRQARAAVEEDLVDTVCLACLGNSGQAKQLQDEIGCLVLDPVLIALKVAEFRATLWRRFGISHSDARASPGPAPEVLR